MGLRGVLLGRRRFRIEVDEMVGSACVCDMRCG